MGVREENCSALRTSIEIVIVGRLKGAQERSCNAKRTSTEIMGPPMRTTEESYDAVRTSIEVVRLLIRRKSKLQCYLEFDRNSLFSGSCGSGGEKLQGYSDFDRDPASSYEGERRIAKLSRLRSKIAGRPIAMGEEGEGCNTIRTSIEILRLPMRGGVKRGITELSRL